MLLGQSVLKPIFLECFKIKLAMFQIDFPQWDIELFSYLNKQHTSWLDPVMIFLSSYWSWLILFAVISYFMLRRSRTLGIREIILILCTVGANNVVNGLVKVLVKRPRPCQNELLDSSIRILENCGTNYSFFSAHSSNAFCLAICTAFFFKNKYYTVLMLIWATAVAYSRIYVGKHYPLDLVFGISFGVFISLLGNWLLKYYPKKNLETNS